MNVTHDVLLRDIKILFGCTSTKMMCECKAGVGHIREKKKVKFVIALHANRLLINNFMFSCTNIKCFLRPYTYMPSQNRQKDRRICIKSNKGCNTY